jgi:hypothetical protein
MGEMHCRFNTFNRQEHSQQTMAVKLTTSFTRRKQQYASQRRQQSRWLTATMHGDQESRFFTGHLSEKRPNRGRSPSDLGGSVAIGSAQQKAQTNIGACTGRGHEPLVQHQAVTKRSESACHRAPSTYHRTSTKAIAGPGNYYRIINY